MSIIRVQLCVGFWTNKWNMSHWVKYANIRVFSDTYFLVCVLGFYSYTWRFGLEKTFISVYLMQCPTESFSKLKYNILLHCTCKILPWSAKLAALCRIEIFKNSFFTIYTIYTINEWNKLIQKLEELIRT